MLDFTVSSGCDIPGRAIKEKLRLEMQEKGL